MSSSWPQSESALGLQLSHCSETDVGSAELGKRRRRPPPTPFSAWQPGDAAMQGQRKKKQREKEERVKEKERVAAFRQSKKETDSGNKDKN